VTRRARKGIWSTGRRTESTRGTGRETGSPWRKTRGTGSTGRGPWGPAEGLGAVGGTGKEPRGTGSDWGRDQGYRDRNWEHWCYWERAWWWILSFQEKDRHRPDPNGLTPSTENHRPVFRPLLTGKFSLMASTGCWKGHTNWCFHSVFSTTLSRYCSWLLCRLGLLGLEVSGGGGLTLTALPCWG